MNNFFFLIPAKANSSRVPFKNFRPFYHQSSLVDLTVELALSSEFKFPVIVSTDNSTYSHPSNRVVKHLRSSSLAKIETPVSSVMSNIHDDLSLPDNSYFIVLQPTSPFRTSSQLDSYISFSKSILDSSPILVPHFSIYKVVDCHPARMYFKNDIGLEPVVNANESTNSQDLPDCYHRNGCFYTFPSSFKVSLHSPESRYFVMPHFTSINIDTPLDFNIAKKMYPDFVDGSLEVLCE